MARSHDSAQLDRQLWDMWQAMDRSCQWYPSEELPTFTLDDIVENDGGATWLAPRHLPALTTDFNIVDRPWDPPSVAAATPAESAATPGLSPGTNSTAAASPGSVPATPAARPSVVPVETSAHHHLRPDAELPSDGPNGLGIVMPSECRAVFVKELQVRRPPTPGPSNIENSVATLAIASSPSDEDPPSPPSRLPGSSAATNTTSDWPATPPAASVDWLLQCDQCGEWLKGQSALGQHKRDSLSHSPKKWTCEWPGCTNAFTRKHDRKRHVEGHHLRVGAGAHKKQASKKK